MRRIYFDVGANDGSSSIPRLADPNALIYAFEPNPEMIAAIYNRIGERTDRYVLVPKAVSDYNGKANFNICVTHDRGCSSLLEVSEAGRTQWGGRTDMLPASSLEVDVI